MNMSVGVMKDYKLKLVKCTCLGYNCLYVYYESIKREPKIRGIYECRCDERLQTKTKKFTLLPYTGLGERFANTMGECEN